MALRECRHESVLALLGELGELDKLDGQLQPLAQPPPQERMPQNGAISLARAYNESLQSWL